MSESSSLLPLERYSLVKRSANKKVGPRCAVVQASCVTCPTTCPFYFEHMGNGETKGPCYGLNWPLGQFWKWLSYGEKGRGQSFKGVLSRLERLTAGELVRYGDVGDLPGKGNMIDAGKLRRLSAALEGKTAWCYTHKPLFERRRANWAALAGVTGGALVINLSGEGWKKPDALLELGLGPVATVLPRAGEWRRDRTRGGVEIRRCPAEYSVVTCSTCGGKRGPICARWEREYVVGFTAHGAAVRRAEQRIAEVEMGILGWD